MATPQCSECGKADSWSAHRFLLTCSLCRKSWHHRCHRPPVSDDELVARIKATDLAYGLATWRCKACAPPEPIEILDLDSPPFNSVPIDSIPAPNPTVIDLTTLSDNAKNETSVLDLTTLSDYVSDEEHRLASLSIDDSSMAEPVVNEQPDQVHAPTLIAEWNTSQIHRSIPQIAPLGWMRRALHIRQQHGRRPHQNNVANSDEFYFNVSDLVAFIQKSTL